MKWNKEVDEPEFRYQLETGKMSMADGSEALPTGITDDLKMIAGKDQRAVVLL